ncbi:MAG: SIR2 family protein [Candidatus Omnitrophota bacterium]
MSVGRVFVLGSGFSASLGLPTLNNLFKDMMSSPVRDEGDKEEIYNALKILYPHFETGAGSSYPSYEEFLSLIFLAKDFEGAFYEEGYWEQKEKGALRILIDYIVDKSQIAESSELLLSFINNLNNSDVVITFNWDNLIERSLFNQKRKINFKGRDDGSVTVLKLHGSINWQLIPDNVIIKEPDSVEWLCKDKICHTKDYRFYDLWVSLDRYPFIVPPIVLKRPAESEFLKEIWFEAFNCLIESKQTVVIGYSIPNNDLQARALLRSGIIKPYLVIDPNPEIGGKYYTFISSNLKFHQECFTNETLKYLL